jgi:hypothetical protein
MPKKLELVKVQLQAVFTIREADGAVSGETVGQAVVFADKLPEYLESGFAADQVKWAKEVNESPEGEPKPNRAARRAATKRKPKAKPRGQ